jgi:ferredoxin--NADP+ reductase
LQGFSQRTPEGRPRKLHLRFFVSPLEILGDEQGRVRGLRLAKNRLERDAAGRVNAVPTGEEETLEVGLVFRSVGYRGVALPDVPYDAKGGVIPNQKGHVLGADGAPAPGLYVSGWIKRGPSGVIGNNKADSVETMNTLLADATAGTLLQPANPSATEFEALLCSRQENLVTFGQWKRLDKIECERGAPAGRPRVKMTSVEEMLDALTEW